MGWDAFKDGTVNPANTVYGITTALAADGLVEAYCLSGSKEYLDASVRALERYAAFSTVHGHERHFWYSDQKSDSQHVVNVSAMLSGVLARVAHITGRDDLRSKADQGLRRLVAVARRSSQRISWPYIDRKSSWPNDAVHAGFIISAILKGERHLGRQLVERRLLQSYAEGFVSSNGFLMDYQPHEVPKPELLRQAKSWGLGMLVTNHVELGLLDLAKRLMKSADLYRISPTQFAYRPGETFEIKRATAFLLLAAATLDVGDSERSDCLGAVDRIYR